MGAAFILGRNRRLPGAPDLARRCCREALARQIRLAESYFPV